MTMLARCYCPEHGRLGFDEIVIKNRTPICSKCSKALEFGTVKPRTLKEEKHGKKK
jgi:hypothetical protein